MQTATITPKFINPPKAAGRSASIKDIDGVFWGIPENMMSKFTANVPAKVTYEETAPNEEGRTYRNIKSVMPAPVASPQPSGAPGAQNTGRDIFITGVVQRAMQTGQFAVSDIRMLTLAARDAWDEAHGSAPKTNGRAQQRNDEPPYDDRDYRN
jgi:hypothetical protein